MRDNRYIIHKMYNKYNRVRTHTRSPAAHSARFIFFNKFFNISTRIIDKRHL